MIKRNRERKYETNEKPSWTPPDDKREKSYLKTVRPRSANQDILMKGIESHTITIVTGPAGCGKTYLAVVKAVEALKKGDISRIIITRPVIESGESIGFLSGDLAEKMDPWMRPIYDALLDRIAPKQLTQYREEGVIEIAPLAYMRGRTFANCFIIVDEAQNMTLAQLKMLLTRLGWNSTMVITGDPEQTDLPYGQSGLIEIVDRLEDVDEIAVIHMNNEDIVRHPLISKIILRLA